MQARFIQDGNAIDYVPAADTPAGSIVALGSLVGVTKLPIVAGTLGALALNGVYDLTKGAIAFSVGDPVYWTTTGAAKSGTVFFGLAVKSAAQTDGTVRAVLIPRYAASSNASEP